MTEPGTAALTLNELREFASFAPSEQRYIRRSLDVALGRRDASAIWARHEEELGSIRRQYDAYRDLNTLRAIRPDDSDLDGIDAFIGQLIRMAAFDLTQERITCFSAFRFLYERLLGAWARPWLPAVFCGAAALPQVQPEMRRSLLSSISENAATATGWSDLEPSFYPEFIEKEGI